MDLSLTAFEPLLKSLASAGLPYLGTAVGAMLTPVLGPFGMLVSPAINLALSGITTALGIPDTSTPQQIADVVATDPTGAKAKLAALEEQHRFALQGQKHADDYAVTSQAQQVAIGTAEISNPSLFIAGPRPMIEWGLGGLLMVAKTLPFAVWALANAGLRLTAPPDMDITTLGFIAALLGVTVASHAATQITGTAPTKIGGTSTVAVVKRGR